MSQALACWDRQQQRMQRDQASVDFNDEELDDSCATCMKKYNYPTHFGAVPLETWSQTWHNQMQNDDGYMKRRGGNKYEFSALHDRAFSDLHEQWHLISNQNNLRLSISTDTLDISEALRAYLYNIEVPEDFDDILTLISEKWHTGDTDCDI